MPMANQLQQKTRTVLEPFSEFSPTSSSASVRSLALFSPSDSETLVYVGTSDGSLSLFTLGPDVPLKESSETGNSNHGDAFLLRTLCLSNFPVESIHVFGEIEKVLVVSDGFMHFVDLQLVRPVKKISTLRGVSLVARRFLSGEIQRSNLLVGDGNSGPSNLLQKLGGGIRSNGAERIKESDLPIDDNCVFVATVGKRLVLVGLVGKNDGNYDGIAGTLVSMKEIQCNDLVRTMAWVDDSIFLGTQNGYVLCSCVTGQCNFIFTLPDASSPPRVKLLTKECKVFMLVDNLGITVNSQGQPIGGSMVFNHAPDAVAELGSCIVVVGGAKMEVYLKKPGTCVQAVSFGGEEAGSCVIADEEDGNGKLVAVATSSKVVCYRRVPAEEQIKDLLRKKIYREAIFLVEELQNEGEISDELLSFVHAQVGFLLLFDLRFGEAVNHFLLSETMQPSELFPFIVRDPNRWSLVVPRKRYWGLHPPPAPLENVIEEGLMAIQRAIFLKKAGLESSADDEFFPNPPNRAHLLDSAIKNIIRYLKSSRGKDLSLSVKEGVDTLLMYLYRTLNYVDEMERLASSDNYCIVEELETLLNDSGHLRTLAFLCASKGMSTKALAIWRLLARNYSSAYWRDSMHIDDSEKASMDIGSRRENAAIEASRILEDSSDQDLILQHLGWIADISDIFAIQVLTSEKRTRHLSPDVVVAAIDPKKLEILQRYLQWLIEDQGSDDTRFHTSYALLLAKSSLETFETFNTSQESLGQANISDSDRIFQSSVRERLQIFLESSDLYDPEEILNLIEGSELWLEKAILYRKLGQETIVLKILALKVEDCDAAEHYCLEIGRPDAYMQLLEIYLNPEDGKEPMFKAAVRLLHNHGESLDPLQVLERLSPDMPLQLASETILRMLRARLHHYFQGKIVHNLSRAVVVDASLARLEERSRHIQINDESLCDSCHARLGTKLFAMYPDDTIVCYKCYRRQGESTSVTGRDFKRDIIVKPGWLVTR